MKVIFLDFNGILDTYENLDVIDEGNINRVKKLCDMTGSSVVFSSSGRFSVFGRGIMQQIIDYGIDIIGVTPKINNRREEEIKAYLEEHPEIDNYCILDDDFDMPSMKEHLVKLPEQTKGSLGFTENYYQQALAILGLNKVIGEESKKYGR